MTYVDTRFATYMLTSTLTKSKPLITEYESRDEEFVTTDNFICFSH